MGTASSRRQLSGDETLSPAGSRKDSPYYDFIADKVGTKPFFKPYNTHDSDKPSKNKKGKHIIEDSHSESALNRKRSSTISETKIIKEKPKSIFSVFRWTGGGKHVYVSGSWDNWKAKIPMVQSHGDFATIIEIPEGKHQYKFMVDNKWLHDEKQAVVDNDLGTKNNVIEVNKTDFEVFEALAVDIASLHPTNDINASIGQQEELFMSMDFGAQDVSYTLGEYGQIIPAKVSSAHERNKESGGSGGSRGSEGPPILPPQLLQVILNRDVPYNYEPALLPEPNHVMINHLYALSIKDGVLVLSCTHRHRKKYVTTLFYKPIK